MNAGESIFVRINAVRGVLHARIHGPQMSQREAPIVLDEIAAALAAHGSPLRVLLLDFTDVQSMSSLGLGMCLELRRKAREAGGRTVICGLTPQLGDLFGMLKFDRLCTIARDEPDLRRALAA
jgi:anti-anti-sigma factor